MMFKKPIQTILLAFAICFCLLFGIGQNPSIAATITEAELISPERMQTLPETNLESGVDSFLTMSAPGGEVKNK